MSMSSSEVYVLRTLEQLRLAHLKLVAADSHLRCDEESDPRPLVRLRAISADLARLIRDLEPDREQPVLEGEVRVR